MYEMMVGQPPFVDDDPMGIYQQILNGKLNFPRFIERSAKSLIKKMLVADLTKRYGCLKGGAADIKKHKFFQGLIFDDRGTCGSCQMMAIRWTTDEFA